MTYVSAVALARAIGFERLLTVLHCGVRLGGAVQKATRLLKLPRAFDGSTPDSFVKESLQENFGVVQPFRLIQFTPGHEPSPTQSLPTWSQTSFPATVHGWIAN
jgi:hypothetical protein